MALPLVLALLGIACLVYGAMQGQVRGGLFLIFPFVAGTGIWGFLGMLLLMAAAVSWFFGQARRMVPEEDPYVERLEPLEGRDRYGGYARPEPRVERRSVRRGGGLVMIGPVPIFWGSDRGVVKGLLWLGLLLVGGLLLLMFLPLLLR
ncbi:MAG TPA: DUF131 domain-containing protein [Candidatus Thermoplasmatota archaeon]|nr:DUF131 domain-containing protein [Candidatus Thermoplasmatota archaeon]